jgi:hypothetical protein
MVTAEGVQRVLSKNYDFHGVKVESVVEVMKQDDFAAKGDWVILMAESMFSTSDKLNQLMTELKSVLGHPVKKLSLEDMWRSVMDFHGLQSLSEKVLVI